MADKSGVYDNTWQGTQRLITSGLGTQVFSSATTGGDPGYSLDPTDTSDYFYLKLTQRSSLVLSLNNLGGNADLALLDNGGGTLQTSSNGGTLAESIISNSVLEAGDYYIQVSTPDNSTTVNQYTLSVNTIPTSQTNLLWRNFGNGQNVIWQMNGLSLSTYSNTTVVRDSNWKLEATGDMNGDGSADYVWRNYATGSNAIWLMNGTTFQTSILIKSVGNTNYKIEGTLDFNRDGKTDILWRNNVTGENLVWFMNGINYSSFSYLQSFTDSNYQIGAVGDFNQDGQADLVWRNTANGQNLIWVMNGASMSYSASLTSVGTSWYIGGVADLTGDGKPDIIWRNGAGGTNSTVVWQMNGTSLATYTYLYNVSDGNWKLSATAVSQSKVDLAGDTIATAFDLGTLNGTGLYNDRVGGTSDGSDYYKFTLAGSSTFNMSLTGLTANADAWLIYDVNNNGAYDANDVRYDSVNLGTADEQFQNLNLAAGTYFLRIFTPTSETGTTAYALNLGAALGQPIDLQAGSTFTITKTNGTALPLTNSISTISLKTSNSTYVPAIKINYQVKNSSVSFTPSQFKVNFYLSRDPVISSANDLLLSQVDSNNNVTGDASVTVSNLSPNQTYTNSISVAIPDQAASYWGGDQTYYIGMIIDPDSQVPETNEINNIAAIGLGIKDTIKPDVVGGGLNITQTSSSPSQSIRITGTIKNIGNVATSTDSSATFFVRFYFSNDDVLDGSDSPFAGTLNVKTIAANSSVTFDSNSATSAAAFSITPLTLPDSSWQGWRGNGRYYILMDLNVLGAVQETSGGIENNSNYGRTVGQYLDYDYIDITGAPTYQPQ